MLLLILLAIPESHPREFREQRLELNSTQLLNSAGGNFSTILNVHVQLIKIKIAIIHPISQ